MRVPDFKKIREDRAAGEYSYASYASGVHPNPRFYKYFWWVFWSKSEVDGKEFLSDAYRLSTAVALNLMKELAEKGEPYWIYNRRLPRHDPSNPFDYEHPRSRHLEWATSYDNDTDPVAPEPFAGHK
jgi:hypothetical protein